MYECRHCLFETPIRAEANQHKREMGDSHLCELNRNRRPDGSYKGQVGPRIN